MGMDGWMEASRNVQRDGWIEWGKNMEEQADAWTGWEAREIERLWRVWLWGIGRQTLEAGAVNQAVGRGEAEAFDWWLSCEGGAERKAQEPFDVLQREGPE